MSFFMQGTSVQAAKESKGAPGTAAERIPRSYTKSMDRAAEKSGNPVRNTVRTQSIANRTTRKWGECNWESDPDIWLYRTKTRGMLRRYMRWSLEAGRVPSVLGRELFRARISAYSTTTFEARVIFLHDVERCLDRLQEFDRKIIARVCLQEFDHEAAAQLLHCTRRTLLRRLPDLIDKLSQAFLVAGLLDRLPETKDGEV